MFKKPFAQVKTTTTIRRSDRKKLKQKVAAAFNLEAVDDTELELLVPEGLQSLKFSTHLKEPGVVYLSVDGDPLWFTVGKKPEDLIPTVYTLWKRQSLLPIVSTPPQVIDALIGGADLMIPGVTSYTRGLATDQLVAICTTRNGSISAPLAVGRMALPSDELADDQRGKAVRLLHVWKDHMWDIGSKPASPPETQINESPTAVAVTNDAKAVEPPHTPKSHIYSPDEVSQLLHLSLLNAIATLPPSTFPISGNAFFTSHIIPSRPAFPFHVLPPTVVPQEDPSVEVQRAEIAMKNSSHRNLNAFLKAAEKSGLLTLKGSPKQALTVTGVNAKHAGLEHFRPFPSVGQIEKKEARREKMEEEQAAQEQLKNMTLEIRELWTPHGSTVALFEAFEMSTSEPLTLSDIRSAVNAYLKKHPDLINKFDPAYVTLSAPDAASETLRNALYPPTRQGDDHPEFIKRTDLMKRILTHMQEWHEIRLQDNVCLRKGKIRHLTVSSKARNRNKATTLISQIEPYDMVIQPEQMAEDLRKICAGSTSVTNGRTKGTHKVVVQGKQEKLVVDYLVGRGIPRRFIHED
ncbi:hypothetical protein FISHEDRAFT_45558 [Fistulina hepatica ATCC 64428]|uniref:SUI1 domain-containing protein n=1 Tax=Fistulina hepatica ATCC 64428 TaxID=1128425 RepID=A0A0D7A8L0_9AGAR|nr:hypothetical protein FISHEDRAFT_45558 [Fistulina hepatica ATCC 64428]